MLVGRLCGGVPATFSPSITTSPAVGCSKPAIIRSVVVLPQPLGPRKVKNSPCPSSSERSSTAVKVSKRLVTLRRATLGDSVAPQRPTASGPVVVSSTSLIPPPIPSSHQPQDDRPARHPAELRAHRLGHPGEAGAAVRVGFVHVVVAGRDQEHRDEADQQDRGRLRPHHRGDEAERRGEAVPRRRRGDADHHARHEADRVLLQPLVFDPAPTRYPATACGSGPPRSPWSRPYAPLDRVASGECPKRTASTCTWCINGDALA